MRTSDLQTDRPPESAPPIDHLPKQAFRSGAITLFTTGVQVVLGMVGLVVLARVLTPADFGLVAMTAPVTAFSLMIRDFGLSMAVAQHPSLDARQIRTLFWLSLKLNLVLAAGGASTAPFLAWLYGEPRLVAVTLALVGGMLVLGMNTIQLGLLRRHMRFGALAAIDVGATTAGVGTGLAAALGGLGFWALVLMSLTTWGIQGIAPFLLGSWRSAGHPDDASRSAAGVRSLVAFGSHMTVGKLIMAAGEQVPFVLVGYLSGPGPLGLFQKAFQFAVQPFLQVYLALLNVSVVTLSKLRDDVYAYRDAVRKALLALFSLTMPILAFLIAAAPDVVPLVLGTQWEEMVPLFRVLAVGMAAGSLVWATRWVYYSEGRARELFAWTLLSTPVLVAATAIGAFWGYTGVAVGYSAAVGLLSVPGVWFCVWGSRVRGREFWQALWRPTAASMLAGVAVLAVPSSLPDSTPVFLRVVGSGVLFGLVYTGSWIGLPGGRQECADLVIRQLRRAVNKSR